MISKRYSAASNNVARKLTIHHTGPNYKTRKSINNNTNNVKPDMSVLGLFLKHGCYILLSPSSKLLPSSVFTWFTLEPYCESVTLTTSRLGRRILRSPAIKPIDVETITFPHKNKSIHNLLHCLVCDRKRSLLSRPPSLLPNNK